MLGDEFPLLTVDAPDISNTASMIEATTDLLEALRLNYVHVVGSSLGGYLAQALALARPQWIGQLVIANGFCDPAPFVASLPHIDHIERMSADSLVKQNMKPFEATTDMDDGQARVSAVMKALVGPVQSVENYKSRVLLMMRAAPLAPLPLEPAQIVIVDDDADPMVPPLMRNALRERYASAQHEIIAGGGHLPAIQRPEPFAVLLRRRFASGSPV